MTDHIPFISSQEAAKLAAKVYQDSEFARVALDKADSLVSMIPSGAKVWIDSAIDGFHSLDSRRSTAAKKNPWYEFISQFPDFEQIAASAFWEKPKADVIAGFVYPLLDKCLKFKPSWITVPQLPNVSNSSRNKMNRALAKASGDWKMARNFQGSFILPLVFTNQDQINGKTERNPQVNQAQRRYHEARADGFWVVDQSLTDDNGSKTLRNTRFPALVQLHQELNDVIPSKLRIAGPYWGMNILLWARGLVDYPAIGVGNSYQYYLAGGYASTPATCLAIPPLRRRVGLAGLDSWLDDTLKITGSTHPDAPGLILIRRQLTLLSSSENARDQVARFYKRWLDLVATTPKPGRALALFQDLSAAYAFGKVLPLLNKDEETARRPESVAEPLMLNCL